VAVLSCVSIALFNLGPVIHSETSKINQAVRRARSSAVSTDQTVFLDYKSGKFLVFDSFGKKISELTCDLQNFSTTGQTGRVAVFDRHGFFKTLSVKCGNVKYVANRLSGMLHEKAK
jgi:hypothetical protein